MNVTLPPKLAKFVRARVKSGLYASTDEIITTALAGLAKNEAFGDFLPGELDRLLETGPEILAEGGRMVVISFMSIDDRKVKVRFRELARQGRATLLTKHPLVPGDRETAENAASRSAKLRAIEITKREE